MLPALLLLFLSKSCDKSLKSQPKNNKFKKEFM